MKMNSLKLLMSLGLLLALYLIYYSLKDIKKGYVKMFTVYSHNVGPYYFKKKPFIATLVFLTQIILGLFYIVFCLIIFINGNI